MQNLDGTVYIKDHIREGNSMQAKSIWRMTSICGFKVQQVERKTEGLEYRYQLKARFNKIKI